MNEQYRVVKISYSEELSSESELWFRRFIEKILLDHVAKAFYGMFSQMEGQNIGTRTSDARKQYPSNK